MGISEGLHVGDSLQKDVESTCILGQGLKVCGRLVYAYNTCMDWYNVNMDWCHIIISKIYKKGVVVTTPSKIEECERDVLKGLEESIPSGRVEGLKVL